MSETIKRESFPAWLCIVLYIIGFVAIEGVLYILFSLLLGPVVSHFHRFSHDIMDFTNEICLFLSILFMTFAMLRYGEKRRMNVIGFQFSGQMAYIFMGFIIATLIIGGGFYLLLKMGEIKIQRVHFLDKMTLIYNIVLYIIVALTEEIAFRGYILGRLLRTNMHGIWALIISAIVFMLMHGANNHITMLPMFNLFLAGVLLGSVYIYTKNLWYGISLHFFWNFLQGPIFGFSVSGIDTPSIFKIKHSANILINGGEFGFEGSLLCSVLCIVVIAVTILIMNRTHKRTHLNDTCIEG